MSRTLLIRERRIDAESRVPEYHAAWHSLERAARSAGARAWVFQSTVEPRLFVEFVEWTTDRASVAEGVMLNAAVELANATLETIAPAASRGTWSEWTAE